MPTRFDRRELRDAKELLAELPKSGCISVSSLKGKHISVHLKRDRIIEHGQDMGRRMMAWCNPDKMATA